MIQYGIVWNVSYTGGQSVLGKGRVESVGQMKVSMQLS